MNAILWVFETPHDPRTVELDASGQEAVFLDPVERRADIDEKPRRNAEEPLGIDPAHPLIVAGQHDSRDAAEETAQTTAIFPEPGFHHLITRKL